MPAGALDGWLLYITNHYTHPVKEAQAASPRHHLAKKLAEKGQRMIVFCPLGRHVGSPFQDFITNLAPKRVVSGNTVYLFPPLIYSPASATTALTLVLSSLFLIAYLSLTRARVVAQYSTTMLVSSVGAVIRQVKGIPLVANYGDPDFARETGLSRKAFRFCEDLVMARGNAYAIVYVDEVIGRYVRKNYGVKRTLFLPNGGYEESDNQGSSPEAVRTVREKLGPERRFVLYAGQISRTYRLDLLVPAAKVATREVPDVSFLIIGEGPALPRLRRSVAEAGLDSSFIFLGSVPYARLGPYLDVSSVGLQLLDDMCMGTKVLMYMVHKLPVISTGSWFDQYHEFLRNEDNSVLIPPDSEELTRKLIELLSDRQKVASIAENAWLAVKPYSWDRHADETLGLLHDATKN